jgi:hypothetical protein
MTRKILCSAAAAAAVLATTGSTPAVSHDRDRDRRLKADLKGFRENPALSTPGRGSFRGRVSEDGTEVSWWLDYRDTETAVTQAHIHFGAQHTNGGISVFLCTNLGNRPVGTPACPVPGPGFEATGILRAADVIGPAGQGIAAGEFSELLEALRAGFTYVNVHTTGYPGGEIRGQIRAD